MAASLEEIKTAINKAQGWEALYYGAEQEYPDIRRISTGSLHLDWATNGGIPVGRITEIFGKEGSGKSAIAGRTVAQAQKKGLNCVWIDAENSFDPEWMTLLGVDCSKLLVVQSSEGEEVLDLMMNLVSMGNPRSKEFGDRPPVQLLVCDSVAALTPMKIMDDEMEQAQMAVEARMMNKGVKRINARAKNTAVVFINQVRTGFGRMASDVTPGGRGLGFYSSLRLEIRSGEWIKPTMIPPYMKVPFNPKDKDTQIGHTVRCRVRKSKVGPGFREANFDFYYNGKIDQIKDIITAGKVTGAIEQAGSFFKYNGDSFQGAARFAKFLREDKEALKAIRSEVLSSV